MKMSKRYAILKQNRHEKKIGIDNLNNKSTNVMMSNITSRINKKMIVSLSLILVTIFAVTFATSYAFFTTSVKGKNFVIYTGNLAVDYEKKTDVISLENLYPMTDDQGLALTAHEFDVKNNGNIDARYQVRLELDNTLKDMISPEYIKIAYSLDGSSYSDPVLLSNLDTSLAFIRNKILKPTKSNTISVKLWLDLNAPNEVQGKQFKARIVVDSIQNVEEGYVVDAVPIIYLNKDSSGNQDMIITTNSTYTELGVNRVLDDKQVFTPNEVTTTYEYYDGITTTTVSSVNTSKVGIYYVTYSITDSENNVGKAVRVVAVGDEESLKIYHDIDSVIASFNQSSLKQAIMCSYIDGNDRMYFDCKMHDTIEDALASKSRGSIIVTSDITLDSALNIDAGNDIVLELNEKNVEYLATSDISTITNYGTLSINDYSETGTLSTNYRLISNFSSLTINNGNFIRSNADSTSGGVVVTSTNGNTVINGGNFETDKTFAIFSNSTNCKTVINNATVNSASNYAVNLSNGNGTIEINDGTFTSDSGYVIGIASAATGTFVVNGGKFESSAGAVISQSSGTLNILNGQFISENSWGMVLNNGTAFIDGDEVVLDDEGNYVSGTYIYSNGNNHPTIYQYDGKLIVNGGTIFHGTGINGTWRQAAFRIDSSPGIAILNGGTFESTGNMAVENGLRVIYTQGISPSTIKINGAKIKGGLYIGNEATGYICKGEIGRLTVNNPAVTYLKSSGIAWGTTPTFGTTIINDDTITCLDD